MKKIINWDKQTIGHFFLGIGIIIFLLNIVTFINVSQYYNGEFLLTGYYLSVTSSITLIIYSLYNIYE